MRTSAADCHTGAGQRRDGQLRPGPGGGLTPCFPLIAHHRRCEGAGPRIRVRHAPPAPPDQAGPGRRVAGVPGGARRERAGALRQPPKRNAQRQRSLSEARLGTACPDACVAYVVGHWAGTRGQTPGRAASVAPAHPVRPDAMVTFSATLVSFPHQCDPTHGLLSSRTSGCRAPSGPPGPPGVVARSCSVTTVTAA